MTEIYLYSEISEGAAQRVTDELREATGPLTVRVNSPGGLLAEGLAVYNALTRYGAEVTVEIDGLAASVASLIAMAGDRVRIAEAGLLMIHAPWVATGGNARELRKTADALDQNAAAMVGAYARKSGRSREDILSLMEAETWLTAEQAVQYGFADEVVTAPAMAASVRFDLTRFANPPTEVFKMNAETKKPEAKAPAEEQIVARERDRVTEIYRATRAAKLDTEFAEQHIRAGTNIETFRAAVVDAWAAQEGPDTRNHVRVTAGNERDTADFRAAAVDGVLARYSIPVQQPHPASQDFRHLSVKELAQACLSRDGRSVQGDKTENIMASAMTTSDFPALMENIAEKALMSGFSEAEASTHRMWTRRGSIADFKRASRVAVSEAPPLEKLLEEGEIRHGPMSDAAESIQLETFARIVSISRKAMVNDDLDGLTRIPRAMGLSAVRKESDLVYSLLTSGTSSNGPTMRDANQLFDSSNHANLAGTGAAPSLDALSAARSAMMRQKGLEGSAYLNIRPRFVICPVALEDEFFQLLADITPSTVSEAVPQWIRELTVVADPRLDDVSENAWYLAADPGVHDTLEVATLDGDGPNMAQDESFNTAGMRWRVIADIGVAALDWRGLYRNPGV